MPVLLPESLEEACHLLAAHPEARPMAGGTDLLVHWPQNLEAQDKTYLDLGALAELRGITWTEDELVLGALATYWQVIQDGRAATELPLLAAAGRQVGAVQIQARGTWAGNLVNASPAADGVPVLMAYDAVVDLVSAQGEESVAVADFYLGYKEMRRRPEQLIARIRIPRRSYGVQLFEKVGSRRAQAITKVGIAITNSDAGWRVVANSVAPTVRRCKAVEALLESASPVNGPEDLHEALSRDVSPIDDVRSTARYRRQVLARVLFHALADHWPGS